MMPEEKVSLSAPELSCPLHHMQEDVTTPAALSPKFRDGSWVSTCQAMSSAEGKLLC